MDAKISNPYICIVDDDAQVRRFLLEVLASVGLVAEEYSSGEDFMRRWRPGHTDCVLLDIRMPRITGPEVHEWLRQRNPEIPVIFLSGYADVPTAVRAMRLGAFDFLEKPFNVQHLIERINAALHLADERKAAATSAAVPAAGDDWQKSLTPREQEILAAIVTGKRNKVIAADLGISERTVETHRAHIMAKSGAGNVIELVGMVASFIK
ncbi:MULTISPECIES: response regulator [Candidatus Accumulibacter]|uniref:Transcriptional regulatory protein TdiR n=1 Tax=Candidatus Accumulibacter cognatus TaxID=2954383 RepID=A0A080M2L8_9PROT|nr:MULTISPECIES: response regulator [Candidatus Accumulibacter]KFB75493.1 MAG: Transcriptional regulatory protein TdiR [Candidatus Accumulibacter cognatus]MCM8623521.1 response regulator [Accumulibacter sp.]